MDRMFEWSNDTMLAEPEVAGSLQGSEGGRVSSPNGSKDDAWTHVMLPKYERHALRSAEARRFLGAPGTKLPMVLLGEGSRNPWGSSASASLGRISEQPPENTAFSKNAVQRLHSKHKLILRRFCDQGSSSVLALRLGQEDDSDLEVIFSTFGERDLFDVKKDFVLTVYRDRRDAQAALKLLNDEYDGSAIPCTPVVLFQGQDGRKYFRDCLSVRLTVPDQDIDVNSISRLIGVKSEDLFRIGRSDGFVDVYFNAADKCWNTFEAMRSSQSVSASFKEASQDVVRLHEALLKYLDINSSTSASRLENNNAAFRDAQVKDGATAPIGDEPPQTQANTTWSSHIKKAAAKNRSASPQTTVPATSKNKSKQDQDDQRSQGSSGESRGHGSSYSHRSGRQSQENKDFAIEIQKILDDEDKRTSVMVKNIPNKYTQKMVLQEIDEYFPNTYDFFYLPIDFQNKCNIGYGFINFSDAKTIPEFFGTFNNRKWNNYNSGKICEITYARLQGKDALVKRFERSSIMDMDPECRPIVFSPSGESRTLSASSASSSLSSSRRKQIRGSQGTKHSKNQSSSHQLQPAAHQDHQLYTGQQPTKETQTRSFQAATAAIHAPPFENPPGAPFMHGTAAAASNPPFQRSFPQLYSSGEWNQRPPPQQ